MRQLKELIIAYSVEPFRQSRAFDAKRCSCRSVPTRGGSGAVTKAWTKANSLGGLAAKLPGALGALNAPPTAKWKLQACQTQKQVAFGTVRSARQRRPRLRCLQRGEKAVKHSTKLRSLHSCRNPALRASSRPARIAGGDAGSRQEGGLGLR